MRLAAVGILTKNRDAMGKEFSGGLGGGELGTDRMDLVVVGDVSSHLVLKFDAELVSS